MRLNEITHTARRNYLCACCGMTVHAYSKYVRVQVPGGGLVAKKPMHSKCYLSRRMAIDKKGGANVGNIS